jgi:hypothetical protein
LLPPGFLVTSPMNCAMVGAAKRNGEFIAGLAAERARLHKSNVMRVRGLAAAQHARLLGYEPQMLLVAVAAGSAQREDALVDPTGLVPLGDAGRAGQGSGRCIGSRRRNSRCSRWRQIPGRRFWAFPSEKADCFRANAVSTILASVPVSVFLRGSASRAQATALSWDSSPAISLTRRSRSAADCSAGRTVEFAGLAAPIILPLPDLFGWTWTPVTEGLIAGGGAQRSGASRSSSPAMPTRVKSAYRRA